MFIKSSIFSKFDIYLRPTSTHQRSFQEKYKLVFNPDVIVFIPFLLLILIRVMGRLGPIPATTSGIHPGQKCGFQYSDLPRFLHLLEWAPYNFGTLTHV